MTDAVRAALLGLAAAVSLAIGLLQVNPAVRWAEASVEEVAAAAGGVYVSLRVINAALSTAEEVEIGATLGAQASLQPLKVLEPVDDTVERVADVVFAVAAGAAVAAVGLEPVAALGAVVLAAGLAGLAVSSMVPSIAVGAQRSAARATRLGIVVALVLPMVVGLGLDLGGRMTASVAAGAQADLDRITAEARVLIGGEDALPAPGTEDADGSLFERLAASLAAAGEALNRAFGAVQDYREAAGVFLSEADTIFAATMTLIGVFVLQTVVLPVLLFWGAMSILRRSLD